MTFAIAFFLPTKAKAQQDAELPDRVVLQQSDQSGRVSIRGEILDYTGESLTIRLRAGGSPRTFNAADVVEIETPQIPAHVRGLAAFQRNQFAEAETALTEAFSQESRGWVRRDLLALLVRCGLCRGDYAAAGNRFLQLVASDRQTGHFDLIPLVWTTNPPNAALTAAALKWKSESGDAAQLLSAAALLMHPAHGAASEEILRELAGGTNRRVNDLAWAQLWRLRLQAANVGPAELGRWQSRLEQMPAALRGGPTYLVGQAHTARGEHDRAAAALLWLPLVYDEDHHLTAQAGLQAAESLSALGNQTAAKTMYREVAARFGHTPAGQQAAERSTSNADER